MVPFGRDLFGRPQMVPNTVDETTMRKIAEVGGGEFFRVTDNKALEQVFKKIDQYEKAEIKETRFRDVSDFYPVYLTWALVLMILWMGAKALFIASPVED
jgi:Ca-activated chloride channel family protein